jgi:hypothetical protein
MRRNLVQTADHGNSLNLPPPGRRLFPGTAGTRAIDIWFKATPNNNSFRSMPFLRRHREPLARPGSHYNVKLGVPADFVGFGLALKLLATTD